MKTKANNQELSELVVTSNSQIGNIEHEHNNQTYDESDNQLELSQIVQIMQFKLDSAANSQHCLENHTNANRNQADDFVLSEFLSRLRESLRLQDGTREEELEDMEQSETAKTFNRTKSECSSFNGYFSASTESAAELFSVSFNQTKTNDTNNNEANFVNMQSQFKSDASESLDNNDLSSPSSSSSNSLANYFDSCSSSSSESSSNLKQLVDSPVSLPFKVVYGHYGRAKNSTQCEPHALEKANGIDDASSLHVVSNQVSYGDDAAFIYYDQQMHMCYLGIADGVSANRQRGYDASLFPNALLEKCTRLLRNPLNELSAQIDTTELAALPKFILDESDDAESSEEELIGALNEDNSYAYSLESSTQSASKATSNLGDCMDLYAMLCNAHKQVQHDQIYGSSTVCLLSLRLALANDENEPRTKQEEDTSERLLSTCNLGDSGYMLIRNKQVIFKSSTQSHRYNAPYQLGCTPPELLEHDLYRDRPEDSVCQTHRIKSGDLLIVSSDGLFDNLYEDEIAMIITNHIQSRQEQDAKTVNISPEMLDSACELLVQRASLGIYLFQFIYF